MKNEISSLAAKYGLTKAQVVRILNDFMPIILAQGTDKVSYDLACLVAALEIWQEEAKRPVPAEIDPKAKPEWMGLFRYLDALSFVKNPNEVNAAKVADSWMGFDSKIRAQYNIFIENWRTRIRNGSIPTAFAPEDRDFIKSVEKLIKEYDEWHA